MNLPLQPADALRLPRLLGLATAAYGVKELVQPEHLARAARLPGPPDAAGVKILGAVLGLRDIACGLAMATLPAGRPLRTAIAARAAFDASDCVAFALHSPGRARVAAITLGWASLCAASARWAG